MEMMEAEITIDADVHSEIAVWTPGWDNEDSKGIAEAMEARLKGQRPDAATSLASETLLQSDKGRRFEKVNRTTLFMDFHVHKTVISARSQYTEENILRREIEDELMSLYKDMEHACRFNTRMKVKSTREVRIAV